MRRTEDYVRGRVWVDKVFLACYVILGTYAMYVAVK